jgi:endonuclease/exonuclease/phosphatase family metal-dependent hydrolase
VARFNIHSCRDADGNFDPERTAEALRGFDLIGLNEVRGGWQWQRPDQAQLLGRRLDLPWLFAPTEWRWWRDDFGNGLLCRYEVARWQRQPLTGTRHKGHRNRLLAEVRHHQATIHVIVTHLDRVQDRAAQLKEVTDEFLALPEPALLMGDLNTPRADPCLARVLTTPGVCDLVGESIARDSSRRIDWILARGLRSLRGGLIDTGASDHPLVWAEVEVESAADRESHLLSGSN